MTKSSSVMHRPVLNQATFVEPRCCPLCHADNCEVVETQHELQFFVDDKVQPPVTSYSQVRCRSCGLLYMNPCYSDEGFNVLFKLAGRSYGDGGGRHDEQIAWLRENECLSREFSFMDIGCFEGDFLLAIPAAKALFGIDFDQHAIERALKKPGLGTANLISGRFEDMELDQSIDVFTMFHVLEHLPEPVKVLERLAAHAHQQTKLILEVPILELGPCADIHGFYSPQHLSHFSKHTLAELMLKSGWKIISSEEAAGYNGYRVCAKLSRASEKIIPAPALDYALFLKERALHFESRESVIERLNSISPDTDLIIWGAGMHLEMLYQKTNLAQLGFLNASRCQIVDGDPLKQGEHWRGLSIQSPEEVLANEIEWCRTHLLISSYGGQEQIAEAAQSLGVPAARIVRLYEHVRSY